VLNFVPRRQRHHLVDFGSGLGRVLILALASGYGAATGVELSAALCMQARQNLGRARLSRRGIGRADCVAGDAAEYPIQSTANVFYFYNPFGSTVLGAVLDNIENSLIAAPREAWILYVNAVHADCMLDRSWLEQVARITSQGYNSAVFHHDRS
jgi:SAM-dependent methyltransferase